MTAANEAVSWVDSFDMFALDLWATRPSGWADGPLVDRPGATLGGRAGTVVVSQEVAMGGRDMALPWKLITSSPELCYQRLAQIKSRLYAGAFVHIRYAGWTDREAAVEVRQVLFEEEGGVPGESLGGVVTAMVRAPKPFMHARRFETYALRPGLEVPIAVGDAPCDVDLRIFGPTGPEINVRVFDAGGTERGKLVLAGSALVAGESLLVVGEGGVTGVSGQIVKTAAAGATSEAYGYLSPLGDYLTLDEGYGIPDELVWPYLTIDSGTAIARVRRQFR